MTVRNAIIVGLVAVVVGCSSSDETTTSTPDSGVAVTAAGSDPTPTDPEPTDPTVDETQPVEAEADATTTSTTTTEPPVVDEVVVPSAEQITLLSPVDGQGTRPLLSWEPIDGATYYAVTVYAADERPYWASVVVETETFVGGPVQIDEDKPGPRITADMSWLVVAYGDDQLPIAVSGVRPISP